MPPALLRHSCRARLQHARTGLTLVEIIIAIMVFSVGGLGLAASSAVLIRQMSRTDLRLRSAFIARTRDENFHAGSCGSLTDGEEIVSGVRSIWRVSSGRTVSLDQELEHPSINGTRSDHYHSAIPCG